MRRSFEVKEVREVREVREDEKISFEVREVREDEKISFEVREVREVKEVRDDTTCGGNVTGWALNCKTIVFNF